MIMYLVTDQNINKPYKYEPSEISRERKQLINKAELKEKNLGN